uniref:IS1 transposase n=1 Tax=mine drainage metagenome TaxID=410659 RepID=E6Q1B3_9ZZZZ
MNRLPLAIRVQILSALVEGNSIRGTARMTGTDKKTVLRLLADVGDACDAYLDESVRGLKSERIQCDEIWSFCHAKERNLPKDMRGADGVGDLWTWTAIDADSKLMVTWHLGKRLRGDADLFVRDLASRVVTERVQISTDGLGSYSEPIQRWFARADYGTEVKDYGLLDDESPERKYSPLVVKKVVRTAIWGVPDPDHISTAYVERQNLTMRMSMRRFTRLTNGFSKKALNLQRALALHFMHYNFCRKHSTIKTTPAIKAGLTDRVWTLHDLANLPELMRGGLAA